MNARATRYPPPGYSIRIAEPIWEAAIETMLAYAIRGHERGKQGSEALVYLAGILAGDQMIVTGLYLLNHIAQGDRVVVTREEARWLLTTLRARDEKLVGQMHSHRGYAGHSLGDDLHATSFHDGFLSIVVPRFGCDVARPVSCAVLEFRSGVFVELSPEEVGRRLQISPQLVGRSPAAQRGESSGSHSD